MNIGEKIKGLVDYFRSEDFKITLILVKKSPLTVLGLALTIFLVLVAIFAPLIAPYDPIKQDLKNRLQPPQLGASLRYRSAREGHLQQGGLGI